MTGGRLARLWALRGSVLSGLERFPVSLLALACFVVLVNLEIAGAMDLSNGTIARAAAAAGTAAAIAAAVVLFGERRGFRNWVRHVASMLPAVIAAVAILFWEALGVAPPALLGAAVLTVPLAPYVRGGATGFWAFIWSLMHAGALAFIAIVIFCLGLSAILISLNYLFGLPVEDSVYGHVWSIGLGFVGPLFALSMIPTEFPAEDSTEGTDIILSGVRLLSDFVAVPLLAAYALILHAYAAKILFAGELPKNQLGWMVLSFGFCTLALRIVVHPLRFSARRPTRLFLTWWAVPLVVPQALLVSAVSLRIAGYGITPERYGLGLFAVFLGLVLLAQIPRRLRGDIRLIPALGAVCLFVASFGAWGMLSASGISQAARISALLEAAGPRQDGPPLLDRNTAAEVHSIIGVLDAVGQLDRIRPLFAGRDDDPFESPGGRGSGLTLAQRVRSALGVEGTTMETQVGGGFWLDRGTPAPVPMAGYDLVIPGIDWASGGGFSLQVDADLSVSVQPTPGSLIVKGGPARVEVNSDELRRTISARLDEVATGRKAPPGPFFVDLTKDGRRIGILFEELGGVATRSEFRIDGGRISVFLRRADWG